MTVTIELNDRINLVCNKSTTFTYRFTLRDENDALVDLTGKTAKFTVKQTYEDTAVIHQATVDNSGITMGGAEGWYDVTIPASASKDFIAGKNVFDTVLISGSVLTRITEGDFIVRANVTDV